LAGNLTPTPAGLGGWDAEDFWRALHEGRSRDGRRLLPVFPYPQFTHVTREDADALFAYLRALTPVAQHNAPHALRFPYNTQAALARGRPCSSGLSRRRSRASAVLTWCAVWGIARPAMPHAMRWAPSATR
jgi:hypothetical protein